MSSGRHVIDEEIWLELTEVARCYRITVREINSWIDEGLLHRLRTHRGAIVLATVELEVVATLIRLTRVVGLDPSSIRSLRDVGDLPGLPLPGSETRKAPGPRD